jgi:hypothetical protein
MNETATTNWPEGTQISTIQFAPDSPPGQPVLMELAAPILRRAIPIAGEGQRVDLYLLTIPTETAEQPELDARIRIWLLPDGSEPPGTQHLMLQGAQIYWALPRVALLTPPSRLEIVRTAVLEMAYVEAELQAVERALAQAWPAAEADAPLAFSFEERDVAKREALMRRFQAVLLLRSRLAKITPRLLIPQVYPPTLASQVQERLRERLNVTYRVEALETQLEMFERIYDQCSQRTSDYMLTRKSLTLEWVIVLLLALQVIFQVMEILSTSTPGN